MQNKDPGRHSVMMPDDEWDDLLEAVRTYNATVQPIVPLTTGIAGRHAIALWCQQTIAKSPRLDIPADH